MLPNFIMSKKNLIIVGVIVLALILLGISFSTGDRNPNSSTDSNLSGNATSSEIYAPDRIDALHQFDPIESTHILAGQVNLPTPCHILDTEIIISESYPEQVTINFQTQVEDPDQMCAQVITSKSFKVTFSASEEASISAIFNGQDVELNLREVGADENLEEFEVYTKG